jgi:hypothetical protein
MVEHVTQPDDEIRPLGQGRVDGRLEGELEVALALVDPFLGRDRVIRAPEVGVAEGSYAHDGSVHQRSDVGRG